VVLAALHCHECLADHQPGDLGEQFRAQLRLLDEKAAEFSNSSLVGLNLQTQWAW
jgi:hypothetical protein